MMGTLLQDIRYGIRRLAKSPGFTVVTVLTLALCIGANTAIFSAVNAILIRPLPYQDSSRLVSIWTRSPFFDFSRMGSSIPDFRDIQSQSAKLSQISAYRFLTVNLTGQGAPQELSAAGVSPDFFSMLGVAPLRGRSFLASEMQPGQDRVAVLSYGVWRDTFGSDPRAIGRTVTLDDKPYTIVGVMPPAFDFPNETKLWTPLVLTDKEST